MLTAGATLAFDLTRACSIAGVRCDQLMIQKGALCGLSNAVLQIELHDGVDVDGQRFRIISGGGDLTGQSFRTVMLTGRTGRRADVIAGNGFVDVAIRNTLAGTGVVLR